MNGIKKALVSKVCLAMPSEKIVEADVYPLPADQSSDVIFEAFWKKYEETKSIFKAQIHIVGCAIPFQMILLLIYNVTQVYISEQPFFCL